MCGDKEYTAEELKKSQGNCPDCGRDHVQVTEVQTKTNPKMPAWGKDGTYL